MSTARNRSRRARRKRAAAPKFVGTLDAQHEAWVVGTALVLVPPISDDASPPLKIALARRREVVFSGGCCPCGARAEQPTRRKDGVLHAAIVHQPACPASDDVIGPLLRAEGFA
jgi:hypothetical protein